jgi:hypothetical protein
MMPAVPQMYTWPPRSTASAQSSACHTEFALHLHALVQSLAVAHVVKQRLTSYSYKHALN